MDNIFCCANKVEAQMVIPRNKNTLFILLYYLLKVGNPSLRKSVFELNGLNQG
jgi:hypothetical protein